MENLHTMKILTKLVKQILKVKHIWANNNRYDDCLLRKQLYNYNYNETSRQQYNK